MSFFTLYLRLNAFLVLAFGAFRLVQFLTKRRAPLRELRWGQALFLAALAMPALGTFLPPWTSVNVPEIESGPLPEVASTVLPRGKSIPVSAIPPSPPPVAEVPAPPPTKQLLFIALLAGMALAALRLLVRLLALGGLLRRATPFKRYRRVRLVVSDEIAVPFSLRLPGHAWVVLPEDLLARWRDARVALRHELQHHRQYDTHWAMAVEWLVAFFFPNPAAYLWRAGLQEAQELSCDRALTDGLAGRRIDRHEYASCLIRVAETALRNRRRFVGTASLAAASRNPQTTTSFLKRRIEMLSQTQPPRSSRWVPLIGTGALLLLASLAGIAAVSEPPSSTDIGPGVVTTEPAIQKIADDALRAAVDRFHASLGLVVVTDPKNGRVLAVANIDEAERTGDGTPHWALSRQIEPGSLAKTIVAAYALAHGQTQVDSIHDCGRGNLRLGDRVYHDWKAFDKLTTAEAIQMSSNTCGIRIGERVGASGLAEAMHEFGIGPGGTADGFAEARVGEYPDPAKTDPARFVGIVASGYDAIHLSPIELLQAYGAIANGGNLLKPRNGDGKAEVIRRVLPETTAAAMRTILANVMGHGTANEAASKIYRLAGKTSTGYSRTHVNHDSLGGESNLASFIGFGPVENPRVAIYVVIENPRDHRGVHGSTHAAPVFTEVAEKALAYLGVPHSK